MNGETPSFILPKHLLSTTVDVLVKFFAGKNIALHIHSKDGLVEYQDFCIDRKCPDFNTCEKLSYPVLEEDTFTTDATKILRHFRAEYFAMINKTVHYQIT